MNYSLCFLALTWSAGSPPPVYYTRNQVIQPVAHTTLQNGQPVTSIASPCCEPAPCCCRPSLLDRLRCLFSCLRPRCRCQPCCGEVCDCNCCEPPQYKEKVPQVLPEKAQAQPEQVEVPTVSYREPVDPNRIKKEYMSKVGHDEDYRCVTGQLFHVHSDGGLWVVRYAPIDQEDRFGGSVVLAPATSLQDVREGDLVRVHGEILTEGRASKHLGGPLYRALTVELMERSNPVQNIPSYPTATDF